MPRLFETTGDRLDVGYMNLRAGAGQAEREIVAELEAMWALYQPYADADFLPAFARDPEARFWEMFLGCSLLQSGKRLIPASDRPRMRGGPDLGVLEERGTVWIEAIAPTRGENPVDAVPELPDTDRVLRAQPKRQLQLRITSALATKSRVTARYIERGLIANNDAVLVAIGASRFGIIAGGPGIPLALSAVFPLGDEFVRIDRETMEVVDRGYEPSFEIPRENGAIPRSAFLDGTLPHVSGLVWCRASIGNMDRRVRPLSLIHNPTSVRPMPQGWNVWDREFIAAESPEGWSVTDIMADVR